jgi:hypothetical protein
MRGFQQLWARGEGEGGKKPPPTPLPFAPTTSSLLLLPHSSPPLTLTPPPPLLLLLQVALVSDSLILLYCELGRAQLPDIPVSTEDETLV